MAGPAKRKMNQSIAERQRNLRARRINAGLIRVQFWIRPEWADKIKEYIRFLKG